MRDHMLKTGFALLAAAFIAVPLSVSAGEKMNKTEDKVKGTASDMKEAGSDTWITSKTKIALFADDRVKARDVSVETTNGEVYLRVRSTRQRRRPPPPKSPVGSKASRT
jgi:osmotically-inducible protein OsmY